MTAAARRVRAAGTPGSLLVLFAALTAVHLIALAAGWDVAAHATKPLLVPALAAHAVVRGGSRGLTAALACGWGGDVLLEVGGTVAFMAGMGCFAAGHVCYLRLFAARGALAGPGRGPAAGYAARNAAGYVAGYAAPAGYAVVWAVMITLLWPGLDPGLRVPVALYSLLLTAMAAGAGALGRRAAIGGALFLLSDGLIAAGLADWRQPPGHEVWIMLTYALAQALLATAVLRVPEREPDGARPYAHG